jgi:hypothetical protein
MTAPLPVAARRKIPTDLGTAVAEAMMVFSNSLGLRHRRRLTTPTPAGKLYAVNICPALRVRTWWLVHPLPTSIICEMRGTYRQFTGYRQPDGAALSRHTDLEFTVEGQMHRYALCQTYGGSA